MNFSTTPRILEKNWPKIHRTNYRAKQNDIEIIENFATGGGNYKRTIGPEEKANGTATKALQFMHNRPMNFSILLNNPRFVEFF